MRRVFLLNMLIVIFLSGCSFLTQAGEESPLIDPAFVTSIAPLKKTATPRPTETPLPTVIPTETPLPTVLPTETPVELTTPQVLQTQIASFRNLQPAFDEEEMPYAIQAVSPLYLPNFAYPEVGCSWMGVAGQVFDPNGLPVDGLVVVVEGYANMQPIEALGFTGLAESYGPGGYEVKLADVNSDGIFWIQLFDQQSNPLTDIYTFEMPGTCEGNLALINFSQQTGENEIFLPMIDG